VKIAIPEMFRRDLDGRLPVNVDAAWYQGTADVAQVSADADVLVMAFVIAAEIRLAIESARCARWISSHAAGVDHYPLALIRQRGALLTKGAGLSAVPIAESVVLFVLSAAKSFPTFLASSARHRWPTERPPAIELGESRALIIGYGEIGRALAQRLSALGVEVTGVRRTPRGEPEVIGPLDWQARLGEFDWVILTTALTPQTRHLLSRVEFAQMKSTAWVVNIARGGLIDQAALAEALHAGRPRGAYLDVTDPEPLPGDDPLWSAPNVFITGHSAGRGTRSRELYARLFLDNLARFEAGQTLINLVDLGEGY
jgi:phosphoglycerate dehydrogenase-like enzyme